MKIAVLTSGGDAPGMNAAVRAVVRSGAYYGHEVYGVQDGYRGLVNNQMSILTHQGVSGMLSKGGTFLGSSRLPNLRKRLREIGYFNILKHVESMR